jgi:diamine N-acetyltransferase
MAESTPPIVNIVGEKIALGPLRREVMTTLDFQWANDFAVTVTLGHLPGPVTAEQVAAHYERILQAHGELWFLIYERATWRPIGVTFFSDMQRVYQRAEFNISIGVKECWGRGYGTETTRLMLQYAFSTLGFNMIWLRVLSSNEWAIRAYTIAGFREAGRLREAQWIGQQAFDVVYMDCLAKEFLSSVSASVSGSISPAVPPAPAGAGPTQPPLR